jgi:predicted phage terminase large subunit-like protein
METATADAALEVRPQPGPQELFLSTPADIGIIGGSLFGGKTWSLVIEPLRHVDNGRFYFAVFRRLKPEITNPGGLWDEASQWYPAMGGKARQSPVLEWKFPSGAKGQFSGLQYDSDVEAWKGAQIALLEFDQLEAFTEHQFFYLLSRNRSTCGVQPYCRASCNPDPDSFVAKLVEWWVDQESGYAIPERSGVIRWFIRVDGALVWSEATCTPDEYDRYDERETQAQEELELRHPGEGKFAKSLTFVLARLQDNKIGLEKDPTYEGNVRALTLVERERLLGGDKGGNWKIRPAAGKVFNRGWFEIVDAVPARARRCRGWDKAGTTGGGDWSVGIKLSESEGTYYVEDVRRGQWAAGDREKELRQAAELDGTATWVRVEQEPGSGGKESAENTIKKLAGFNVAAVPSTTNKVERAQGLAAQAQAGNVKIKRAPWNESFINELHAFDGEGKVPDDQVDAASLAFNTLALETKPRARSLG